MKPRPKCVVCGANTHLNSVLAGFKTTCSQKCNANNPARKIKSDATCLAKYGTTHHTRTQEYKDYQKNLIETLGYLPGAYNSPEFKAKMSEKYGVENIFSRTDVVKQSIKSKYGVENPQQVKEIRDRTSHTNKERYGTNGWNLQQCKDTWLEKYGAENPQQVKEIRDKTIQTCNERYRANSPGESHVVRDKMKATCMERYSVEYPLQNREIFERAMRAQTHVRYKYKECVLPSGNVIYTQGYESQVIQYMINNDLISEDDIEIGKYEIPVIDYVFNGKCKKYFPDIFIRSINMLIEIKSSYTYAKDVDKNLAKQKASKKAGFQHVIMIWDDKLKTITQII